MEVISQVFFQGKCRTFGDVIEEIVEGFVRRTDVKQETLRGRQMEVGRECV